jgi:hypothetical protein
MKDIPRLYEKYHVAKKDERLELFGIMHAEYGARSFLYPGCFVHSTPAFVMPNATFVDTDKRARSFFGDPQTLVFIDASKHYKEQPKLRFLSHDYSEGLPIERTYDLDEYFVPTKKVQVTQQLLNTIRRGVGYKRPASNHVFQKPN